MKEFLHDFGSQFAFLVKIKMLVAMARDSRVHGLRIILGLWGSDFDFPRVLKMGKSSFDAI